MKIERLLKAKFFQFFEWSPSVTLLGHRQIGKTILAKDLQEEIKKPVIYPAY